MSRSLDEVVLEGWLTKSPPHREHRLWKPRWRRRWFVLKQSGELPMQFFLNYYTGKDRKTLKGTIDLDQCDQVDSGLTIENGKQNFPFMFDIKTPKRTYYLAADTESEMDEWVDNVCMVCGLKPTADDSIITEEEEAEHFQNSAHLRIAKSMTKKLDTIQNQSCGVYYNDPLNQPFPDSPPVSPTSSVSGPYIPISDCVSGKPLNTPKGISDFNNILISQQNCKMAKDMARAPAAFTPYISQICNDDISKSKAFKPVALPMPAPPPKPAIVEKINSLYEDRNNLNPGREDKITNIESAKKMAAQREKAAINDEFYACPRKTVVTADDEWQRPVAPASAPVPNWETFPAQEETDFSPGDIGSWSVVEKGGKFKIVDSKTPFVTNSLNRVQRQRAQLDTYSLRRAVAPPRPPKPQHLVIAEQPQAETGAEESACSPASCAVSEEAYDVPRSHQRGDSVASSKETYTNAAPPLQGTVFRYDFSESEAVHPSCSGETISPRFEGPAMQYSNLPSPLVTPTPGAPTPPAVNRDLKPTRKTSESGTSSEPSPGPFTPTLGAIMISSAEASPIGFGPPSIDRTLKPKKPLQEGMITLARPPDGNIGTRKVRAGPSPVPHPQQKPNAVASYSRHEPTYSYADLQNFQKSIQYLDLDLESDSAPVSVQVAAAAAPIPTSTTYRTIDWTKTDAFNRTREEIEEKRKEWAAND